MCLLPQQAVGKNCAAAPAERVEKERQPSTSTNSVAAPAERIQKEKQPSATNSTSTSRKGPTKKVVDSKMKEQLYEHKTTFN